MNRAQLRAVLWLRWQLTRNQWRKSGGLGAAIAMAVTVLVAVIGGLTFFGAMVLGALALGDATTGVVMGVWLGLTFAFLMFWTVGLLTELQRSETLDLQKLMHLPVALGQMFVINYAASHATLSIVALLPAMTGLAIGLAVSRGPAMLLLLPLSWSMVFMITAWTYYLRGWLATMMSNPRRRRAIVMGVTFALIAVVQLPNLYFNILNRSDDDDDRPRATQRTPEERAAREAARDARFERLVETQRYIPPLWVPYGAHALAEGRALPAVFGLLGCLGIGTLGLRRAYRSTLRFYHGQTGGKAAAPATRARAKKARAPGGLLARQLPALPEPAAAVTLGTWQSMLRAPEVKMALGMSFVVTIVAGAWLLTSARLNISATVAPFVVTGAIAFSLFMLAQFLANQFGYDREGFRTFVLSPVDRRLILLGKNAATAAIGGVFGLVLAVIMALRFDLGMVGTAAVLLQLGATLCLGSLGGNLTSILVPFRVEPGSNKPTKMPAMARVVMVLAQMLLPIVLTPIFIPPALEWIWRRAEWPMAGAVNLIASAVVLVVAVGAYWWALAPLGRLLQRREVRILQAVTAGQE